MNGIAKNLQNYLLREFKDGGSDGFVLSAVNEPTETEVTNVSVDCL